MKTNDFHLREREKLLQMPHANAAVAQAARKRMEQGAWSVVVAVARVGMENLKFNRWQLIWPKCSDEAPPHTVSSSSRQQLCRVPAVQLELGQSTYLNAPRMSTCINECVFVCVWSTNVARSTFGNCRCHCRWSRKIEKLTSMKSAIKVGHKCVIRDPTKKA